MHRFEGVDRDEGSGERECVVIRTQVSDDALQQVGIIPGGHRSESALPNRELRAAL